MPMYGWIIIALCIGSAGWGVRALLQKIRNLEQQQEKWQAANRRVLLLEEEQLKRTARRESTEEKLRGYLQLLDTLVNTIPNPIYFKDAQGIFQGCNKVFAKNVLGLTRDRIIGALPRDLPEQIPPELTSLYQRHEAAMLAKGGFHSFEAQVQCADGTRRDFLFSMAPLQEEGSIGSVAVLSDLTDKNRADLDRLQKEKLESVLETAGAVCHEFNQPLQALSGYLELLAAKTRTEDPIFDYIEKALVQIERMRTITAKLQGITHYETMPYADKTKIIDIHKSSQ